MKFQKLGIIILLIIVFSPMNIFNKNIKHKSKKSQMLQNKIKKCNNIYKQGKEYFSKQDYIKAENKFNKALGVLKDHAASHFFLSQIFYKQKNYDKAIRYIKNAKNNFNSLTNINIISIKSRILMLNGQINKLNNALLSLGMNCAGIAEQDMINKSLKRKEQLIQQYEGKIEDLSKNIIALPSGYYYFHGNILFKQKKYNEAKSQYLQAIKNDPFNKQAYNNLINICLIKNNFKDANKYLKNALKLDVRINDKLINIINKYTNTDNNMIYKDYIKKIKDVKRFTLKLKFEDEEFYGNCYIVFNMQTEDAVIIDPGAIDKRIENFIKEKKLKVKGILNTHGHFDHILGNKYYSDLYKVDIYGHINDIHYYSNENKKHIPSSFFKKEGTISFGALEINIYHTPGHTPGSICFFINNHLFSGDTLFKGAIGKISGDSEQQKKKKSTQLLTNIKLKLMTLNTKTILFPGHGSHSTIEHEKKNNVLLKN